MTIGELVYITVIHLIGAITHESIWFDLIIVKCEPIYRVRTRLASVTFDGELNVLRDYLRKYFFVR